MGILERWIRQKRFSDLNRIRDFTASCTNFKAEKFRCTPEKDCVAVDGGFSEPLSRPNSLLTGKFTWEFLDFRR